MCDARAGAKPHQRSQQPQLLPPLAEGQARFLREEPRRRACGDRRLPGEIVEHAGARRIGSERVGNMARAQIARIYQRQRRFRQPRQAVGDHCQQAQLLGVGGRGRIESGRRPEQLVHQAAHGHHATARGRGQRVLVGIQDAQHDGRRRRHPVQHARQYPDSVMRRRDPQPALRMHGQHAFRDLHELRAAQAPPRLVERVVAHAQHESRTGKRIGIREPSTH
ncbi:conserved hypothetical protein [Ricinus communis]|uniref:Uncharacterized protein n=1 Tax=Ricinus communis TaxID=3988 RepID=B9TGW6_RICCO|nr:conserved hypothetical protein [Ricinus communis]